jgi:spermidine synthase
MIRIDEIESPHGVITICRATVTGAVLYSQSGSFQSEADPAGISLAAYVHALFGLVMQIESQQVLMLGCGGGTLGTMLSRACRRVTIVDVDAIAFRLARRYFNLPDTIDCEVADGREFLLSRNHTYDVIVLDAFLGDRIPAHLRSLAFFRLAHARLSRGGSILANVHLENDLDDAALRVADHMANVWPEVRLLDAPGQRSRNAIIMAGDVAGLKEPALIMPPSIGAQEIADELAALRFQVGRRAAI